MPFDVQKFSKSPKKIMSTEKSENSKKSISKASFNILWNETFKTQKCDEILTPVTKFEVYDKFHVKHETTRSGGGKLFTSNTFSEFKNSGLVILAHRASVSPPDVQKMFALCYHAKTVSKTPLGSHVLGKDACLLKNNML